jgi:chemotaxis protein CheC
MAQIFQLTEDDQDQLRELVNIGVSHAGNTLSDMVGRRILVSVPGVTLGSAESLPPRLEEGSAITIAILLKLSGAIDGYVLIFFPQQAAVGLLRTMTGKSVGDLRALTRFDRSIFQELGNVITGGMLQGLSRFLHLNIIHSVPDVVVDMGGAMFNSITASMVARHQEFLTLDVSVCVDESKDSLTCDHSLASTGRMFLYIGPEATERILDITGGMVKHESLS